MSEQQKQLTPQDVFHAATDYFCPDRPRWFFEKIVSKQRCQSIVQPRRIIIALMRLLCVENGRPLSYPAIGKKIGGKDHSTVITGCRDIMARYRAGDEKVTRDLQAIAALLNRALMPINQWPISG